MADKLDELVSGVQKHVSDKRAELTALQTQMRALQSAHADLHQEVEKAQTQLLEVRNAIENSAKELAQRKAEAQRIADEIIAAGHEKRAKAEKEANHLLQKSMDRRGLVAEQLSSLAAEIERTEEERTSLFNEIITKRGELDALKAQARKFADG